MRVGSGGKGNDTGKTVARKEKWGCEVQGDKGEWLLKEVFLERKTKALWKSSPPPPRYLEVKQ